MTKIFQNYSDFYNREDKTINGVSEELWADICGYEGKYQISSLGRLRSTERILTAKKAKRGYLRAVLYRDGVIRKFFIHQLVARAFIPNPLNRKDVNHKNGIKTDNTVINLEWTTPAENNLHAFRVLKRKAAPRPKKKVVGLWPDGHSVSFDSLLQASKKTGCDRHAILLNANGVHKQSKGIKWSWCAEEEMKTVQL